MPKSPFLSKPNYDCRMLDFLGPSPCATIGMLPAINTCRVLIATVVFLFAVVTPTHGQDDLPSVQETEAALKTLRGWISQFETPAMEDAASLVSIKEASGVSIILRHSGRVLGMASDSGGDALMLRRAAGKAMNSVLADPAIAALLADLRRKHVDDPDMSVSPDSFRNDLGRKLTIELEVAGKIAPLIGRTIDQLASKLHPGSNTHSLRNCGPPTPLEQAILRNCCSTLLFRPAYQSKTLATCPSAMTLLSTDFAALRFCRHRLPIHRCRPSWVMFPYPWNW
jgi:hypothetical protein